MFALLGWRELGRDGEAYGLKSNFQQYMPQVLKTFAEFEAAFPKSSHLQGFRYQIAQAYWGHKFGITLVLGSTKSLKPEPDKTLSTRTLRRLA